MNKIQDFELVNKIVKLDCDCLGAIILTENVLAR